VLQWGYFWLFIFLCHTECSKSRTLVWPGSQCRLGHGRNVSGFYFIFISFIFLIPLLLSVSTAGNARWTAPEKLDEEGVATSKADIYCAAMVL
jgi:hypothetical protein